MDNTGRHVGPKLIRKGTVGSLASVSVTILQGVVLQIIRLQSNTNYLTGVPLGTPHGRDTEAACEWERLKTKGEVVGLECVTKH